MTKREKLVELEARLRSRFIELKRNPMVNNSLGKVFPETLTMVLTYISHIETTGRGGLLQRADGSSSLVHVRARTLPSR